MHHSALNVERGVAALRITLQSFEFLQIFPPGQFTHKGMSKKGSRVMAVRGRGGEGLEVVRHKVTVTRESSSERQGEGLQAVLEQERWEE